MAYIGKAPNTAIVNQATSQSFSGNGSTTAFTLTRSVNVGEDLEVFVNNVQQEPGSGKSYTASGTTLTFDEAPPSGTNNVYVIYRGEATINPRLEHDANAALAATTGTFSGAVSGTTGTFSGDLTVDRNTLKVDSTNNRIGINNASPSYLIDALGSGTGDNADAIMRVKSQGTGDSDAFLMLDSADTGESVVRFSNAGNTKAEVDWSTQTGQLNIRTESGTDGKIDFQPNDVLAMRIDEDGYVTMPKQPRASMWKASGGNQNITSSGSHKVTFQSNEVNNGVTFDSSDDKLTVPAAGNYMITAMASGSIQTASSGDGLYLRVYKNGSSLWNGYAVPLSSTGGTAGDEWAFTDAFVAALAVNDYIQLYITDVGTTLNFNINRARMTLTMIG